MSRDTTMASILLYIVCWLLIVIHSQFGQCCGPAEIGKEYNITSSERYITLQRVIWQLGDDLVLYNSSEWHPNPFPQYYYGTRTQLTIKNVSRMDETGAFQHIVNSYTVYTCTLSLYRSASTPTCENVTLTGNQISTKCTTAHVSPQAKCQFTLQNGLTDRKDITDGTPYITYRHTAVKQMGDASYSTSCTLQYHVDGLQPGEWVVKVYMYPAVTGASLAQATVGQALNTVKLSVPTVSIISTTCPKGLDGEGDTNVRQGYIRQRERASCLCTRTHAGNPPGNISWSSAQEGNFNIITESEDESTILINSQDKFTCQITSVLEWPPQSMTYIPQYAYGPNEITVSLVDPQLREVSNEPFNLCSYVGLDIIVVCAVNYSDVQPELTNDNFTLTKPNAFTFTQPTFLDKLEDSDYRLVNRLRVISGGNHSLACEARNPKFSDIYRTDSVLIEVREPPRDPPVTSARSNQHGDVLVEDDDVTVTCAVSGGYPSVHLVTLSCGQDQSVTSDGTSASLILNQIGMRYNNTYCKCRATHVTGCYNLMGVLLLTIMTGNSTKTRENDKDTIETDSSLYTTTELVGTAIGSIAGSFLMMAVIAVIVFIVRREKANRNNRNGDRVSENAKQQTDHIYSNQVYGDCPEAIEPDLNEYVQITDK